MKTILVNNLVKGPLDDTKHQNIKVIGLLVSRKKIFKIFPLTNLCKTCDLRDGAILALKI